MACVVTGVTNAWKQPRFISSNKMLVPREEPEPGTRTATDSSNFETECLLSPFSFPKNPSSLLKYVREREYNLRRKAYCWSYRVSASCCRIPFCTVKWKHSQDEVMPEYFLRAAWNEPVIFLVLQHAFHGERPYHPEQSGSPFSHLLTLTGSSNPMRPRRNIKELFLFHYQSCLPHCFT